MSRQLTQAEMSLAREVFKDSIDLARVRLHDKKFIFFQPDQSGMTPNGQIYVHGIYSSDYANDAPLRQAFFIHEMVHVWQHQNRVLTLGVIGSAVREMIVHAGKYDAAYPYALDAAKELTDYRLEQQASIIEDYFRMTRLSLEPRRAVMATSRALYEKVLDRFLGDPLCAGRPRKKTSMG